MLYFEQEKQSRDLRRQKDSYIFWWASYHTGNYISLQAFWASAIFVCKCSSLLAKFLVPHLYGCQSLGIVHVFHKKMTVCSYAIDRPNSNMCLILPVLNDTETSSVFSNAKRRAL